jgi:hypothetical protein
VTSVAPARRRRVAVGHIALALPLVAAIVAARLPVRDNSYLWHVRAGTVQMDAGEVLTSDPFTFTAFGAPWRTQSWLIELLYGWGDRLWGLQLVTPLVVLGSTLLVAAIALRAFRTVPRPLPAAIGLVWIMWLSIGYFTPRPVLFSLSVLAIFLLVADVVRLRWTLPVLFWLWAGVHGGFIVGLGYLVLDGLRRRDRRRLIDFAAASFATLLTAHGWGAWEVVLDFLGNSAALDLIVEWLTPNFISIELFPFALGIVAIVIGAIQGKIVRADLWVIIPFLLFSFTANRSVPISGLVLAPFIVRVLSDWRLRGDVATRRQTVLNSIVLAVVVSVPWALPLKGGLDHSLFAVRALEAAAPGRLFHDDAVGGYLIYAQWPERQAFIDDRAELFGDQFSDFVNVRAGHAEWSRVFERYGLTQALLKVEDPLAQVLAAEGWTETYRDRRFVLLRENEPSVRETDLALVDAA